MSYREDAELPGYWSYDGLRIQADVEAHQFVVDYARRTLAPGTEILDIAAGEGALAKQLQDAGFRVACTSWNEKLRVEAPSYRVDLDHEFSPSQVGNRTYPLVCAVEIIEHVENPAAFLRSCATVVAPGGRLIVSTPNVESASARLQWLIRGYPLIFSEDEVRLNRHISMQSRPGLEFTVRVAGFEIVEKHLLGAPRLRSGIKSLAKRALYAAMEGVLGGDVKGTTRLYVLDAAGKQVRHRPDSVF